MTAPVIAFFNNKGGVGTTSLVYHLAWMYAISGRRVLAVDLDPQANLTTALIDEPDLERIWPGDSIGETIHGSLQPLLRGVEGITSAPVVPVDDNLALLPGDLALARFEDELWHQWSGCLHGDERAFRVTSAFHRLIADGIRQFSAELALVDTGPNLSAINRAALVAANFVVVPLAPDLFSLQSLRDLGPALRRWRVEWHDRLLRNPGMEIDLPAGEMKPIGYVLQQHGMQLGHPVVTYQQWMPRIPLAYRGDVLGEQGQAPRIEDDPNCLVQLRHYTSLMPMAQDARKPIFELKPADGATGGHQAAVHNAQRDFSRLAGAIARLTGAGWRSPTGQPTASRP